MKFKINKKYVAIGIVAFLVIICAISFFLLLFRLEDFKELNGKFMDVLRPVIMGIIIAYLLSPLVNFFERKALYPLALIKKDTISEKLKGLFRVISIILSIILISVLVTVFIKSIIPELSQSIKKIAEMFPTYVESLQTWLNGLVIDNAAIVKWGADIFNSNALDVYSYLNNTIVPKAQELVMNLSSGVISAIVGIWNFLLGAIISIYLLFKKELFAAQSKKIIYSFFSIEKSNSIIKDARFISDTFIGFIVGKIIDSLIIGVLAFIGLSILKIPYTVLISVIIGVTNIIPFFGPFIGAIPSAILVLMVDPLKCLYLVIFIFILQQLDGNVIGPKILGESTGISGFWVIFAITLFGGIWGVAGMIVGIPIVAVIYAMSKRVVERRLKMRELPVESWDYAPIKRIEEDGTIVRLMEADVSNFKWKKKEKSKENANESSNDNSNCKKSFLENLSGREMIDTKEFTEDVSEDNE